VTGRVRAMIAAPEPLAVDAGAEVLARGGNAIDAAVTCAFVQGLVDPHDMWARLAIGV
jgi:gamma-glutamyltranspeptidase/glutathione hydrolase